jgi:hypothetical protein
MARGRVHRTRHRGWIGSGVGMRGGVLGMGRGRGRWGVGVGVSLPIPQEERREMDQLHQIRMGDGRMKQDSAPPHRTPSLFPKPEIQPNNAPTTAANPASTTSPTPCSQSFSYINHRKHNTIEGGRQRPRVVSRRRIWIDDFRYWSRFQSQERWW